MSGQAEKFNGSFQDEPKNRSKAEEHLEQLLSRNGVDTSQAIKGAGQAKGGEDLPALPKPNPLLPGHQAAGFPPKPLKKAEFVREREQHDIMQVDGDTDDAVATEVGDANIEELVNMMKEGDFFPYNIYKPD